MDPFSEPISKLSDAIIHVIKTTADFKSQLTKLKNTLDRIEPIIVDIQNHNRKLDSTKSEQDMFIEEIYDAQKLVNKCLKIKWNLFKWFTHSLKLKELDQKLVRFFQIEVQAVQSRDIKKTIEEVKHVREGIDQVDEKIKSLALDVRHLGQTVVKTGSMPTSSRTSERNKLGWPVPSLPRGIVGFDEPLKELKDKVVSDITDTRGADNCNIVVVSAAGGCGKTTLVKMLCNDPQIQEIYADNIFFVTVSETPDFIVSVSDFFYPNSFDKQAKFQGNEDAKNKLESFLREKLPGPILLVLDDVWHESYIENFEFDINGYKLLVTSRMIFTKYDVFKFYPLSNEHAKIVFCNYARPNPTIDEILVDQMVKCCKNHPLTLSVVGGSLNGKDQVVWKSMIKSLSQGHSVLDLNQRVLNRLEQSFKTLEDKFKECFLDFGFFLEDQRIRASTLLDMWIHLYNHDDEGVDTLAKIYELSYRNLVDIVPRKYPHATINYCEEHILTQHDLLRQLAINLNNNLPIAKRRRLIISEEKDLLVTNVQGKELMESIEQILEPMQARILSISTGESFSFKWCNIKVPQVEVLMLNFKSKTYTLPTFLKEMQKLRILSITNTCEFFTELNDLHLLSLSNLTRIRLYRVGISSFIRSTYELQNLQKISFTLCLMEDAFDKFTNDDINVWPRLVEMEFRECIDLHVYPPILCSIVNLKKLSIRRCSWLFRISEEFGKMTSLETLALSNCKFLKRLPESITKLQNLSILDISSCWWLKLPENMGSLGGLRTIYMTGCRAVDELPPSVKDLSYVKVICNEKVATLWKKFSNVETHVVED